VATTRCRKSAVSSKSLSGVRDRPKAALLLLAQVLAREDHDRYVADRGIRLEAVQQVETRHVRQAQVEDAAVERPVEEDVDRLGARGGRDNLDIVA
jgi:hypothetical protein